MVGQCHPAWVITAAVAASGTRRFNEDAAHDPRRHGKEVCAVLPVYLSHVNQSEIGLIEERGWLEAMVATLSLHASTRNLLQLVVDSRNDAFEGTFVSRPPRKQQRRYIVRIGWNGGILSRTPFDCY